MLKQCFVLISFLPLNVLAGKGFYCSKKNDFIQVGMTSAHVLESCGSPKSVVKGDAIGKKVPVTRLSYNNLYKGPVYYRDLTKVYDIFSLPSYSNNGNVIVDIVDGKAKTITLNGVKVAGTNACQYAGGSTKFGGNQSYSNGSAINAGDSYQSILKQCGMPDSIDNTFLRIPVPKEENPEIWIYKFDDYSSAYQLTFINGILKEIDNK